MITPDLALVCMSRRRADTLPSQSLRLFPTATICVGEDERDDYQKLAKPLLLHPPEVTGVGPVRQWILDNVPSKVVIMVPDDVTMAYGLTFTYATKLTDTDAIWQLLLNTVECAAAAGAGVAGFNQAWDVRKYTPLTPFALNGWVDGPMVVLSRECRFDPILKLHPDIDFCLQHLMRFRMLWQDKRFAFAHDRWKQRGGNAVSRTRQAHDAEFDYLKGKWGAHLDVHWQKSTFVTKVHVVRKQGEL